MPFCSKCGNPLNDDDTFCSVCGTRQNNSFVPIVVQSGLALDAEPDCATIGEEHDFSFMGMNLHISKEMDLFNKYRLKYRNLAGLYTNGFIEQYVQRVFNLDTYLENFKYLYFFYLDLILREAVDSLIGDGIWTETYDSFSQQHVNDFHKALDEYDTMVDSFNLTLEANQNAKANTMSYIPHFVGFGTSIGGAIASIATAAAINAVRDSIESSAIRNANVTPQQRIELYSRLNFNQMRDNVFSDYWSVYFSYIYVLRNNGRSVWWPCDDFTKKSDNVFENICNPRFPTNKIPAVWLEILKINPFCRRYFKFATECFGDTAEVYAIRNYFGFNNFNNPWEI